jgi:hypothetical protein
VTSAYGLLNLFTDFGSVYLVVVILFSSSVLNIYLNFIHYLKIKLLIKIGNI